VKNKNLILITLLSSLLFASSVEAGYTLRNGRLINADYAALYPADKHFELGQAAMAAKDMTEAARQFYILTTCFPNSPYGQEAYFYLGVAEFYLREFDFSNNAFTQYLKCKSNPQYFIQAIEYKFQIAERLRCGAKRRFCGSKQFPKWATGKTLALKIYDEVIAAMPSSEIAARALYSKGYLLWSIGDYRECIESFQLITKRFPKSDLFMKRFLNQTQLLSTTTAQ
jgi:tetratricopeptide (TPR) repeat protein